MQLLLYVAVTGLILFEHWLSASVSSSLEGMQSSALSRRANVLITQIAWPYFVQGGLWFLMSLPKKSLFKYIWLDCQIYTAYEIRHHTENIKSNEIISTSLKR